VRIALRYLVALSVGIILGFAFTEMLPLMVFGEGAVTTDLGIAFALAVAAIFPAMFVGWVILKSWRGAVIVALVTGAVTSAIYLLDLIERPPPDPLVWPTFLVPAVAVLTAGMLDWRRTVRAAA
jgi:hypothetical protein